MGKGVFMREQIRLSYLEFLIILVVLGVAAKQVLPRVAGASIEEKICSLIDGLETMRAHIDLYRAEHGNRLPPSDCFENFETVMTTKVGRYGPYITDIPVNPFNNLKTVRFDGEKAGSGEAGWRFDTKTGAFQADNDADYAML